MEIEIEIEHGKESEIACSTAIELAHDTVIEI